MYDDMYSEAMSRCSCGGWRHDDPPSDSWRMDRRDFDRDFDDRRRDFDDRRRDFDNRGRDNDDRMRQMMSNRSYPMMRNELGNREDMTRRY